MQPTVFASAQPLDAAREVLKDIIARFEGKLALNATVLRPGTIHVGDAVELVRVQSRSR